MINKRIWLPFFLLLSANIAAAADPKWQLLSEIKGDSEADQLLMLTASSTDGEYRVSIDGQIVSIQNGPGFFIGGEFFLLKSCEGCNYKIEGRATIEKGASMAVEYKEAIVLTSDSEIFSELQEASVRWREIHSASTDWQKSNPKAREAVVNRVVNSVQRLSKGSPGWRNAIFYSAMMLIEVEQYDEADQMLNLISGDVLESDLRISQYIRTSLIAGRYDYATSIPILTVLSSTLDDHESFDPVWSPIAEEVRARLAQSKLHLSHMKGDREGMSEANELLEVSLNRVRKYGSRFLEAQLLNQQSPYFWFTSNMEAAEKALAQADTIYRELGTTPSHSAVLNNYAMLLRRSGRTDQAREVLREAIAILEQFPPSKNQGFLDAGMASSYEVIGDYETAMAWYRRSIGSFIRVADSQNEHNIRMNLGTLARELGDYQLAVQQHQLCSDFYANSSFPVDHLNSEVELLLDYVASDALSEAIAVGERIKANQTKQSLETNKIELQLALLELAVATDDGKLFDRQLPVVEKMLFDGQARTTSYPNFRMSYYRLKMKWAAKNNDYEELESLLADFDLFTKAMHRQLDSVYAGPIWGKREREVIDLYAESLLTEGSTHSALRAFEALELFQARNFRMRRRQSFEGISAEGNLANLELLRAENELIEEDAAVSSQLKRNAAREQFLSYLPTNIGIENLQTFSIAKIQELISEEEMLVRFLVLPEKSWAFIIRKQDWEVVEIASGDELQELTDRYLRSIRLRRGFTTELSSKIFPINSQTQNAKKLILILDGSLSSVPLMNIAFQISSEFESVVRTYSATDYFGQRPDVGVEWSYDIAVFADPEFDIGSLSAGVRASENDEFRSWSSSLARLPFTAKEARAIVRTYVNKNVVVASGKEATSDLLLSEEFRRANLLHIASHGYFKSDIPHVVGIATAPAQGDSGFVSLSRLMNKRITSQLVVISGCETALGEEIGSDGINSLTRGVLSQGAGSVIGTLWPIADEPTADFMRDFYKHLKDYGGNAGKALLSTQRAFRDKGVKEYYWAGFVLESAHQSFDSAVFN